MKLKYESEIKMRTKLKQDFTKNNEIYFEHCVEINDSSFVD